MSRLDEDAARPAEDTVVETRLEGQRLLSDPLLNAGTAFSHEERTAFRLHGLLPPVVETLEQQCVRAYAAFQRKTDDLERHIYLRALQDTNEVLFYRLLLDHVEQMMPIVYTPVVAEGCRQFSQVYRRPRGLFISYPLRHSIDTILRDRPNREVDVIVVTDGERVLGIGDQGVGGLGIPIGKLSLYALIGGLHPSRTLPVVLDVGTNNPERLSDSEYLGWRHERVTGQAYFDFVDEFVRAVKRQLPGVCVQWEDFAAPHARPILERYRDELLTFNDDIQGTAAVALGAILSAVHVTGTPLADQRFVMLGAGSAALGVADYLRQTLIHEGLSEADARSRFWLIDNRGLLHDERSDLTAEQRVHAQPVAALSEWPAGGDGGFTLLDVIRNVRATILIGLSTVGGAFDERVVREMARKVERPIILPLSNPTERAEATAEDLVRWTDGRALIATGSPFGPVMYNGRTIDIAQCNNVYVFPGVGLGVIAARARRITDDMMRAAALALTHYSPALRDPAASLLPTLTDLRRVTVEVAIAVGLEAQRAGLAPESTVSALRRRTLACRWTPAYPRLRRATS